MWRSNDPREDIGEWTDEHPLNQRSTDKLKWLKDNVLGGGHG